MKKLKAYFKYWIHCNDPKHCSWSNPCTKNGGYLLSEPWFRIGKVQFWHTIKIACLCGKVFYNIED
jgi:hypothetical protein